MRQYLLLSCAALGLSACEGVSKPDTTSSPPASQTWLCGREYVNHAWGYQRRGLVLDTAGNIWKYENRGPGNAPDAVWDPRDMTRLDEASLKMRYNGAITTGQKVPVAEVLQNYPLIETASNATPTRPNPKGADMGQSLLYCYTYDAATRLYSQVMLDNKGDWDSTNPSPAAASLKSWLNERLGTAP